MDEPKSAYELAMERLKKQDAESGAVEHKLSDAQKAAIAEARLVYEARLAELQILQRQKQLTTSEPQEIEKMEQEYRRDLDRIATDRDAKIRRIRAESERR
jgi:ADP-ribosylglycohydrolase